MGAGGQVVSCFVYPLMYGYGVWDGPFGYREDMSVMKALCVV